MPPARSTSRNPLFEDPFFRRFFGAPGMPGPNEQQQRSLGSGVLVDAAGLVVTNHHVIDGADQVKVSLADRREFEAEIVLKDARSDLAVLRLKGNGERFPALEFADSDALQVGDLVLAIGNPFAVGQTVTHGIISALARTQVGITDYQFFIQTDAAINPGNSGGALVDMSGRIVGINTAIFSRGGGSIGIGFAIPANMVRVVVASARGGGSAVKRPWLGAQLQTVTAEIAESIGLKRPAGALVAQVTPSSPAARGGLAHRRPDRRARRSGDRGLQRLRLPLRHQDDRRHQPHPHPALRPRDDGRRWRWRWRRRLPREEIVIESRSPFQGVKVSNLSPALADQLRLDPRAEGVVIVDVANGSLGAAAWLPARRRRARGQQSEDRPAPATSTGSPGSRTACGGSRSGAAASRCRSNVRADEAPRATPDTASGAELCSRPPGSSATRRGRSPTGCGRRRWPRWSGRTICSAPTAR